MTGAGPSRRSHTKSRTGCKTCKRRHIRCDELFPQCRNCSKHQVRCDYMDTAEADGASQRSSIDERSVSLSVSGEDEIAKWKHNGVFPFPALQVYPVPQASDLSKDELRLVYHICSVSNDLQAADCSHWTIWTEKIPKFLSIAATYPFVMHAILSFSANHLGWTQPSSDLRNLQVQHGGVALRGLHEAIGNFSPSNAEAIVAASALMCWQSTDWLSYSSLSSGIHSVLQALPPANREQILANTWSRESASLMSDPHILSSIISIEERARILRKNIEALERLQAGLLGNDLEQHWNDQLLQYMHRLQNVAPAYTPEEQFQHVYTLRKWVYWVPISLLRRQGSQGPGMLVLAHLYAAAISLQPLFPDLAATFPMSFALPPLEAIISTTDLMQSRSRSSTSASEIATMMQFARQTASESRDKQTRAVAPFTAFQYDFTLLPDGANISPAFTPAGPQLQQTPPQQVANMAYLGVPSAQTGLTYITDNWGLVPSPGFPPARQDSFGSYDSAEELYSINQPGFVAAVPIWT